MITIVNFEPGNFSNTAKQLLQQKANYIEIVWDDLENFPAAKEAAVIIVRFKKYLNTEVLGAFSKLRIIVSATTGTDHIDIGYCNARGIKILCLKPYTEFLKTIPSTAEHCFALLLSMLRNIPAAAASVREGNWKRELFWGYQLKDKKLGIAGLGRTGALMAKYAHAFDMQVYYYDPYVTFGGVYRKTGSLGELVTACDIISLHVHLAPETHHLINNSLAAAFTNTKYLLNTSRGKIVDEHFVYRLLKEKKLAGIATDVLEEEMNDISKSPLFKAMAEGYNVLITPHIGGATYDALHSCEEFICSKLIELL
jgi:D-3-phosphoglycerate dehydrogenase